MKAKHVAFLALLLFFSSFAMGQGYTFKVLANKGESSVKVGSADWTPVKTGLTLNEGDQIKVSSNSYVGLMHSSGKTLELKNEGVVNVKELAANISSGSTSVASKYADFVLSKMSGEDAKSGRLAATGAVERATDKASLKMLMPSSVEVLSSSPLIRWSELEKDKSYIVTVKDMFDEVLMTRETNEAGIRLNFEDEALAGQKLLIVNVKVKGNESMASSDYGIKKLDKEEAKKLMEEKNALESEIDPQSALGYIYLASFFEQNNLLIDALNSYEQAIKLNPDVTDFKNAYEAFILRNNLTK